MSKSGDYMWKAATLEDINFEVRSDVSRFIKMCEENYHSQVKKAVNSVCEKKGNQLIMLAGPSSSGKTTTARLIELYAESKGRKASVVSLDDFYLDQTKILYFEDGTPDFETLDALDKDYITKCLLSLVNTGKAMLPVFSFQSKRREKDLVERKIEKDEIVIVEGLHAINPKITDTLLSNSLTKMYVSVSSRIFENDKVFFTKRDLRFIRRLIRDYHFRSSSVSNTFRLWRGVRMGEDRYLFPFNDLADVKIDSFHPYEPCIFKDEAVELLKGVKEDSEFYFSAQEYIKKLSFFESINKNTIPKSSLLNEFLG